jgi:hypothetical protein
MIGPIPGARVGPGSEYRNASMISPKSGVFPPKFGGRSSPACLGPGGSAENSPAFQRREKRIGIRLEGTAERGVNGSKKIPESGGRQFCFRGPFHIQRLVAPLEQIPPKLVLRVDTRAVNSSIIGPTRFSRGLKEARVNNETGGLTRRRAELVGGRPNRVSDGNHR